MDIPAFDDPRFIGIGIPWYRRDDYGRVLEIMEDAELLPITFDRWQHQAEKRERELLRAGRTVHRVYIDPDDFVAWCARTGRNVDAGSRMDFAANPSHWPGKN